MARQKRELIWIETPGFTGWGCNLCVWKYQLPKVLATNKAPSIETRCAFLDHRCAPPSEHADVRWNKEIQEWFCTKCGRTSDHIVKGDALVELEQYECGRRESYESLMIRELPMNDHRRRQVIAKLIAARAELEDVLNISTPRARYDVVLMPDAARNEIAVMVRDLERIVQALERKQ